jgi:hypothetical protein
MKCEICHQEHEVSYAVDTRCIKSLLARIEELEAQIAAEHGAPTIESGYKKTAKKSKRKDSAPAKSG